MKDRLATFIASAGIKGWANAARKDAEFIAWVERETLDIADRSFAERVYAACTGERPICKNGNDRITFNSIEKGWRFCGRARSCRCAAESVSASCKKTMSTRSEEEQEEINAKRAATNIEKYGVANIGQTEAARANHAAVYQDQQRRDEAVAKGRATMLKKHGVDSALKLPKVNEARKKIAANMTPEARARQQSKRRDYFEAGGFLDLSFASLQRKFRELGYEWLTKREDYVGVGGVGGRERYPFRCLKCGHHFNAYIYDGWRPACERCFPPPPPSYESKEEAEVRAFIEGLGLKVIARTRSIVPNVELDIYLPDQKIAIEYCGLFWHSEYAAEKRARGGQKGRNCHLDKHLLCEADGIRLITIFSDEWAQKGNAVRERLAHILGKSGERHYARQTTCRPIDHALASRFLEDHHLQGVGIPAPVRYGLFKNDRLISVMTFGKPRRSNNHSAEDGAWELYRFASDGAVVGGASKMFKAFLREHQPDVVRTFADRRWGSGQVYKELGFVEDGDTQPAYWYVEKYTTRHNRYNFAKHKLVADGFDRNKSEREIMRERGFDVIWDCGNMKYKWTASGAADKK